MKTATLLSFIFFMISFTSKSRTVDDILVQREQNRMRYVLKTNDLDVIVINMNYGDHYSLSEVDRKLLQKADVRMIDLVFTDFPKGADLEVLNRQRILVIKNIQGRLISDEAVRWRIIRQTDCKNEGEAKTFFHGLVIHYKGEQTEEERLAEMEKINGFLPHEVKNPKEARKLLMDSTIIKVLERNKEWENMTVVADLTGSMMPYTQQLVLWFKLNTKDKRVKQMVFFNDGDFKPNHLKNIGSTGGIYAEEVGDYEGARNLALKTMSNGGGGDAPENDIEALIVAQEFTKVGYDIVLIADNLAPIKDFSLLHKLDRPIHVILCGTSYGVNLQYLELARVTGGSIHTMEKDLTDLIKKNEGEIFVIGHEVFKIQDGQIIKIPPIKKS